MVRRKRSLWERFFPLLEVIFERFLLANLLTFFFSWLGFFTSLANTIISSQQRMCILLRDVSMNTITDVAIMLCVGSGTDVWSVNYFVI